MALSAYEPFEPDLRILELLPADSERARIYRALIGVDIEGDVYRTARAGIWQLETFMAPHLVRRAMTRNGMDVLSIEPDDAAPGCVYYVRFAPEQYTTDNDWPPAPYYPRPADWPRVWPWERAPKVLRTDAVAGPAGVVLCDLDTTPAALIPVPGCPGLDYSYADMGMIEPDDEPEPPPAARAAMSIALARHIVNATARQRLVGPDKGCTAARNRLLLTHTVSGDAFHYNTERGKGQAA